MGGEMARLCVYPTWKGSERSSTMSLISQFDQSLVVYLLTTNELHYGLFIPSLSSACYDALYELAI